MKYDDSEYFFLNFETDLDKAAAHTHIGMYLAWAVLSGLGRDDEGGSRRASETARLRAREITGGQFLSRLCDGKLTDADFNAEGNAFASHYYGRRFYDDYAQAFDKQIPSTGHDADDICSVPDTWANFDLLRPVLDRRLAQWRSGSPDTTPPEPSANAGFDIAGLQRKADAGDAEAWLLLGQMHISGALGQRDALKAADAYEKAAQTGHAEAAFLLSACYERGDGRPQDQRQCLRWLARAAEGGHGQAAFLLAMAYRRGNAVPQDWMAADALMRLAHQRGVAEAAGAVMLPGQQQESAALAARMAEPGQLVALLSERRRRARAGQAAHAETEAGATGSQAASGLVQAALWLGALNLLSPLLLGSFERSQVQWLSWPLALIGAWGVYAVAPSRGMHGPLRLVLTAVTAALGAMGGLVSLWLLLRRRDQTDS
ncbi:tetratricopeptide repeat protein [Roseateles sp. NT4]|uniref:tetratricopeptide repeat protein n=1 Tax=Roseateles sp. NT4 TaxID=3453715 RepID=UPI003EEF00EB